MNDDMNHMNYISAIAQSDLNMLRYKESTYRGSWKKAGGRSAWFMMRRNMDRLLEMMKQPKSPATFNIENVRDTIAAIADSRPIAGQPSMAVLLPGTPEATVEIFNFLRESYIAEDVFAKIADKPTGDDGTVLACVRDLRRYLLLIEAEMVSRGSVLIESAPATQVPDQAGVKVENESIRTEPAAPGTPDDGGHHARQAEDTDMKSVFHYPFVIDQSEYCALRDRVGLGLADSFYEQRAPGIHRLEPVVEAEMIPRELRTYYTRFLDGFWLLDIMKIPLTIREEFPKLQREMNMFEFEQSDDRFRFMYEHHESAGKYVLSSVHNAWGREA
jgi:hypothetical protein